MAGRGNNTIARLLGGGPETAANTAFHRPVYHPKHFGRDADEGFFRELPILISPVFWSWSIMCNSAQDGALPR